MAEQHEQPQVRRATATLELPLPNMQALVCQSKGP